MAEKTADPKVVFGDVTEKLRESLPKKEENSNGATQAEAKNEEAKTETKAEVLKPEEQKAETKTAPVEEKKETPTAESDLQAFLKQHNISSISELEEKISTKRVKTQDEEEAELIEYGVKQGDFKIDDYLSAKELEKKKDADVVFDDEAQKLRAKNKNITQEEIQKRFDKKHGDVVSDSEGNEKLVLDYDELEEQAKRIREEKLAPIKAVKGKYQSHIQQQDYNRQVEREFADISKSISDKAKINIDDKNSLEYEFPKDYKPKLISGLSKQYPFLREQAAKLNGDKFDLAEFQKWFTESHVKNVIVQDNFANIANVYASKKVTDKELELGKTLENPITDTIDLNKGGRQPAVDMAAEATKLRNNLPKF